MVGCKVDRFEPLARNQPAQGSVNRQFCMKGFAALARRQHVGEQDLRAGLAGQNLQGAGQILRGNVEAHLVRARGHRRRGKYGYAQRGCH